MDLLFSYYDPERESFKNFIFRDSKGLYKYEGMYPHLNKIYIDRPENFNINDYNTDTCKKLKIKEDKLRKCHDFLIQIITELNDPSNLNKVLKEISLLIDSDNEFFDLSKEEINKMDLKLVLKILQNFNFQSKNQYSNFYKKNLIIIESVGEWFNKLSSENQKIIIKIPIFLGYLQLLVDYINLNPMILNKNWLEFDEKLYDLLHLEEYLNKNYNKTAIYNEILLGHFENIDDFRIHSKLYFFSKKFLDDIVYKGLSDGKNLFDILSDNSKVLQDTYKNYPNPTFYRFFDIIFKEYVGIMKKYVLLEKLLLEKIEILIKYVSINPKNVKNKNISFYEMVEQINLFLKLKKDLHDKKLDFINRYPRNNFFL